MEPKGQESQPEILPMDDSLYQSPEASAEANLVSDEAIIWEASEHVYYEKDTLWMIGVVVVGLILVLLSWVVLQSLTFTLLIVVMLIAVLVMAYRPPRTLHYRLDASGVQIEDKHYKYADFRSFGVDQESGVYSLVITPVKRLMPAISVYFPAEDGEKIVDMIGSHLPMEQIKPDIIDRISKKLRF